MSFERVLLTIVIGYLVGSLPTAYLIGRLHRINIFEIGSGNMGTANVVRALGLRWGALVWGIDITKGIAAVLFARSLLQPHLGWANVLGALTVIIGHNWSFFVMLLTGRIRGGKGAATWWGTFVMMVPAPIVAVVALVFAGIIALTRYVSLGVLSGVAVGVLSVIVLAIGGQGLVIGQGETVHVYLLYAVLAGVLVFIRHKENIKRLLAGTERRLGGHA